MRRNRLQSTSCRIFYPLPIINSLPDINELTKNTTKTKTKTKQNKTKTKMNKNKTKMNKTKTKMS